MAQKRVKPGPSGMTVTGLGIAKCSPAICSPEHSPSLDFRQAPIGAIRLARRFGLHPSTAAAVAQLAGIGGTHA